MTETTESNSPASALTPLAASVPSEHDAARSAGEPLTALREKLAAFARYRPRNPYGKRTPGGPRWERKDLYVPQLEAHLNGKGPAIGLGFVTPGTSTTRAAAFDLDDHQKKMAFEEVAEFALKLRDEARKRGIELLAFRSGGARGIHLVALWMTEQDAASVRELMREIAEAASLRLGAKGLPHGEVEALPKSDAVAADGCGNYLELPLARESVPLDENMQPLPREAFIGMELRESRPVQVRERTAKPDERPPATPSASTAQLREWLAAIPNEGEKSLDYDAWRNVLFGIHFETNGSAEGLALAHEFSSRSSKYEPEWLDNNFWPHVKTERGGALITGATIRKRALESGWREDVSSEFEALPPLEEPKAAPERFKIYSHDEIVNRAPPTWRIKGVVPDGELIVIAGQPGTGKSFLALDFALAIATGTNWRGFRTRQGRVVYIAAEASKGFTPRQRAATSGATEQQLAEIRQNFGLIADAPDLRKLLDVKTLIERLQPPLAWVVIDTLARATPGADENASQDMGLVLNHCAALHKATGATVVLVHHLGKDEARGPRGWSGVTGAADAIIVISREPGGLRTATVQKLKEGQDGLELPFKLKVVEVGKDADGDVIDSCVVQHILDQSGSHAPLRLPKGKNERLVLQAAQELIGLGEGGVGVGALIDNCVQRLPYDPEKKDRRRELIMAALGTLQDAGRLLVENNMVKLA